jgi:LCP family protein required for cell wall assembly
MASAYGYWHYELNSIATAPSQNLTRDFDPGGGAGTDGLGPENILLIGNQTRQGLTPQEQEEFGSSITISGSEADIIMILHLDPTTGTASILSVPRDLFSPMPAGSPVGTFQKIDAALNDGVQGPDNLVAAVQDDLGIPINHFIELNFNGFINTVNALGGINVYFPEPVFDAESLLNIPTAGCHHLNGFYALTLVRARHLQYDPPGDHEPRQYWPQEVGSDLARIGRTHTFMKIVADTAEKEGKTDPAVALSFISAVLKQMTIDKGLKGELLRLVAHYRHVNPGSIPELTLPATNVNSYTYDTYAIGDVLFPEQPADDEAIRAWDPQALPTPVPPGSVKVVSITDSSEAADLAGQQLSSDGLNVASETAADPPSSTSETFVLYHGGETNEAPYRAQALYVMKYLSGAVMMEQSSSVPAGTIEVELGSAVTVPKSGAASPAGSATTGSTATAATTAGSTTAGSKAAGRKAATTKSRIAGPRPASKTAVTSGAKAPSSAKDQEEPWDPRAC